MTVHTFVGKDAREATQKALQELGRDAVILKLRPVQSGGLLRMTGRQQVELEACSADDMPGLTRRRAPLPPAPAARQKLAQAYAAAPAGRETEADLRREMKSLTEQMERMWAFLQAQAKAHQGTQVPDVVEELQAAFALLLEREVPPEMARRLIRQVNEGLRGDELRNAVLVRTHLRQAVQGHFRFSGPVQVPGDRPRVVALVGPTGVGKTTTIAKLATHFRYRKDKRIGLVTIDTYRMGAKEQLQQYAELLGIPIRVALTPGELRRAVQELASRDLILLDTAGYSQKDMMKLNEVRAFLAAARPDETHLVVSCSAHPRVIRQAIEVYKTLQVDRILLTKLDEAVSFGHLLDLATSSEHPFSYATQGQEVTEDIGLAEPARMASLVLGEETA